MNVQTQAGADEPLDHSIFEADIEGQAMNMQYLRRILSWARPHRRLAAGSILLVLMASTLAILMPVVVSRVVIDGVLMGEPNALLPDFGMNAVNGWLANLTGFSPLASACLIFDAQHISQGPVAKVKIPHRLPAGFHAAWMSAEELEARG